jgi:hypothetical protein
MKTTLQRIAQSCLAFCLPKQPSLLPLEKLQLSPAQRHALEVLDVREIRLDYRGKDRAVIQHSIWSKGEKDDYLPRALADLPRDTLVITRTADGNVDVRGGPAYQGMNFFQFDDLVDHLLANTRDSVNFVDIMQRNHSSDSDSQPLAA